jgi:hypothetical protein
MSSDGGFAWMPSGSMNTPWAGVASSADGIELAAVLQNGPVYLSLDAGSSWPVSPLITPGFNSIAMSADGSNELEMIVGLWANSYLRR